MNRCKVCKKKPKLECRVNFEGFVFCLDDCYEEYDDSPNDGNIHILMIMMQYDLSIWSGLKVMSKISVMLYL